MHKETLKALKASIAKWNYNATVKNLEDVLLGVENCPLCALFHANSCVGCPVWEKTEDELCESTPYPYAKDMLERYFSAIGHGDSNGWEKEFREEAELEVLFLESLLPKEE
jgi:hypothetical protein